MTKTYQCPRCRAGRDGGTDGAELANPWLREHGPTTFEAVETHETAALAFVPQPVELRGGGRIRDRRVPERTTLVEVRGAGGRRIQLHRLAARAWEALVRAARADGLAAPLLLPLSGFRDPERQRRLWEEAKRKYGSPEEARKWVAPPGGSAHQTGRAIDLYLGGPIGSSHVSMLRATRAYRWMVASARRFGFYPYEAEPWHWEYNPPARRTGSSVGEAPSPRPAPAPAIRLGDWVPSPYHSGRGGRAVTGIIYHYTAGPALEGTVGYFQHNDRKVSAHFVIGKDGRVVHMVPLERAAWHAGRSRLPGCRGSVNACTIGIEIVNWGRLTPRPGGGFVVHNGRPYRGGAPVQVQNTWWEPFTPAQYQALVNLTRRLLSALPSITHVTGHQHVAPGRKSDPGPAFDWGRIRSALGATFAGHIGPLPRPALRREGEPELAPLTRGERALDELGTEDHEARDVAEVGSAPVAAGVPPLLARDRSPAGETLYVRMPLGGETPAPSMTGIFVPAGFQPAPRLDLILYLHGHHKGEPRRSIRDYWNERGSPHARLREKLAETRANVVLVAPTLGPSAQAGRLLRRGALDAYLAQVIAALRTHGAYAGRPAPNLGRLVLAAHSGGGYPMRTLALGSDHAAALITQCWGFDCLYNGGDEELWGRWARAGHGRKLFIYYLSSTAARSRRLAAMRVPNIYVARSTARSHSEVPIQHWAVRIQGAGFSQAAHVGR